MNESYGKDEIEMHRAQDFHFNSAQQPDSSSTRKTHIMEDTEIIESENMDPDQINTVGRQHSSIEIPNNVKAKTSTTMLKELDEGDLTSSTKGENDDEEQPNHGLHNIKNLRQNEIEDCDAALGELGGFGRHQRKTWIIAILLMSLGSMSLYPMGFYELQPKYQCASSSSSEQVWYACTNLDFCPNLQLELDPENRTGIVLMPDQVPIFQKNTSDPTSLYNWIDTFDLVCAPKSEFGYFGSTFFIGLVIGSVILPRLSDNYGRRRLALFGILLHVFGGINILFTTNLTWALINCWMMGFGTAGRMFVMYVWLVENLRQNEASKVTSIMFFFDSLAIFNAAIFFRFIGNDWRYIFGIPMLGLLITGIVFFRQNESPKYYYGVGQYEQARRVLTEIGRTNGVLEADQGYKKVFIKERTAFNNMLA